VESAFLDGAALPWCSGEHARLCRLGIPNPVQIELLWQAGAA